MNSYEPVWLLFFPITSKGTIPVSDQKKVFEEANTQKGKRFIFKHFSTASSAWDFRLAPERRKAKEAYIVYTITEPEFEQGKFAELTTTKDIYDSLTNIEGLGVRWTYFGNVSKL